MGLNSIRRRISAALLRISFAGAALALVFSVLAPIATPASAAAVPSLPWLQTQGNKIVDVRCREATQLWVSNAFGQVRNISPQQ